MKWYILTGLGLLFLPFYWYILSKVQMAAWLNILNSGGKNGKAREQVQKEGSWGQQKATEPR